MVIDKLKVPTELIYSKKYLAVQGTQKVVCGLRYSKVPNFNVSKCYLLVQGIQNIRSGNILTVIQMCLVVIASSGDTLTRVCY